MNKALTEALKEAARLCVLAVIPVIVVILTDLNPTWAGVAIIVLRSVDRYLHKAGKPTLPF